MHIRTEVAAFAHSSIEEGDGRWARWGSERKYAVRANNERRKIDAVRLVLLVA